MGRRIKNWRLLRRVRPRGKKQKAKNVILKDKKSEKYRKFSVLSFEF